MGLKLPARGQGDQRAMKRYDGEVWHDLEAAQKCIKEVVESILSLLPAVPSMLVTLSCAGKCQAPIPQAQWLVNAAMQMHAITSSREAMFLNVQGVCSRLGDLVSHLVPNSYDSASKSKATIISPKRSKQDTVIDPLSL